MKRSCCNWPHLINHILERKRVLVFLYLPPFTFRMIVQSILPFVPGGIVSSSSSRFFFFSLLSYAERFVKFQRESCKTWGKSCFKFKMWSVQTNHEILFKCKGFLPFYALSLVSEGNFWGDKEYAATVMCCTSPCAIYFQRDLKAKILRCKYRRKEAFVVLIAKCHKISSRFRMFQV